MDSGVFAAALHTSAPIQHRRLQESCFLLLDPLIHQDDVMKREKPTSLSTATVVDFMPLSKTRPKSLRQMTPISSCSSTLPAASVLNAVRCHDRCEMCIRRHALVLVMDAAVRALVLGLSCEHAHIPEERTYCHNYGSGFARGR